MAEQNRQKFVIISSCRFGGKHHDKGEELELNLDLKEQSNLVGELNLAGRIALATPEVMKQVREELAAEKREADLAKRSSVIHLHPDVMDQIKSELRAELRAEFAAEKASRKA